MVSILEALAKVTPVISRPFEEFLRGERIGLPWGTTLIFILSHPSKSLTDMLVSLKASGYKLQVLQVGGEEEVAAGSNIAWRGVRQPADFMKIGGG